MANKIILKSQGTSGKISITTDTSYQNSQKSREWAISPNLVDNEDYSSKYYAKKSKEAADVATGAIDDIEASKAEFDISYNTKSQALNTQYTGYVTELEEQKTEAITDIENKTEGLTDLYDEYTQNLTTQETQAIQNITTKETQSIANVGSKETESVANIAAAGEATIGSITTAKNSALAEINTADESALSDIGTALEEAKQEINDTKTGAIDDIINNAAGEALDRIEQIETETTETITNTANNAVITINTAVTTGQNEINSTVTTSKQELNTIITNADTDLTNKINAANTDLTDKVTSAENNIENTATNATTAITNTKDTAINELNTIVNTANTTIDSKVTNVTNMETHVTELEASAEASAELAQKYAENPVDVPVVEGEYSAKHWAQKAADVADVLENPMKNDLSNITDEGIEKIKEIAKVSDEEVLRMTLTSVDSNWAVSVSNNNAISVICKEFSYNTFEGTSENWSKSQAETYIKSPSVFGIDEDGFDIYNWDFTQNNREKPYVFMEPLPSEGTFGASSWVYYVYVGDTAPSNSNNAYYEDIPVLWIDTSTSTPKLYRYDLLLSTQTLLENFNYIPVCTLATWNGYPGAPSITLSIADTNMVNLNWLNLEEPAPQIIDTYVNGTSGYRIWSDGYCEQWGFSQAGVKIFFLKEFKDTNYNVSATNNGVYNSGTIGLAYYNKTSNSIYFTNNNNSFSVGWRVAGYLAKGEY